MSHMILPQPVEVAETQPLVLVEDSTHGEADGDGYGYPSGIAGIAAEWWLLLALGILIALVWKPFSKSVTESLDGRSTRIRNELDEARRLHEEAKTFLAEMERKQRDAMKDAEEIIAHARTEAARLSQNVTAAFEEQMARRERQVMDRISQAEAAAVAEVSNEAVDLAFRAVETALIGKMADTKNAAPVINDAIGALSGRLN